MTWGLGYEKNVHNLGEGDFSDDEHEKQTKWDISGKTPFSVLGPGKNTPLPTVNS